MPTLDIIGCGYLGRAVATACQRRGWRVRALTRNPATAAELMRAGVDDVQAHPVRSTAWRQAWARPGDAVLYCVAAGSSTAQAYRQAYVEDQRLVLDWVHASGGVAHYVYTGSTAVFAHGDGQRVAEGDAGPEATLGPTARELLAAERLLTPAPAGVGRAFVLRLAGLYGPGRHLLLDRVRSAVPTIPGSGEYYLNLIHRDDAVAAIFAALQAPASNTGGIYNIADGNPPRRRELVAWIAAKLGLPAPGFQPDDPAARGRDRGSPAGGPPHRIIAIDKARGDLGFAPVYTDFRAGYQDLFTS
jgi:nucleoside-diphosphate-sugar epimerase